ncbi:MAG: hypothetical protein DIU78_023330 [Pseudomonadota bacterium]
MALFDIGDRVRIENEFADADGNAVDPSVVRIKIRAPDGTENTYTHGTHSIVEKTSTGSYRFELTLSAAGSWHYRWVGTGAYVAASEGFIRVRRSQFANPT